MNSECLPQKETQKVLTFHRDNQYSKNIFCKMTTFCMAWGIHTGHIKTLINPGSILWDVQDFYGNLKIMDVPDHPTAASSSIW